MPGGLCDTLRIALLGKTGSGKSSLANIIFGKEVFRPKHFTSSEEARCQGETGHVHGRSLTVIDTPGFFHSGLSEKELKGEIVRCVSECIPGPHAFLLVLRVEKFTSQEEQVIRNIEDYFSADVFKYSVVVFTHGNQLADEMKIEEFIGRNRPLKDLVARCGERCHVVDNKYWNNNQPEETRSNRFQVAQLINTIEKMVTKNNGGCYTTSMLKHQQKEVLVYRLFRSLVTYTRDKRVFIFGLVLFASGIILWRRWSEHPTQIM
ncbi:GTPase IMAP family member 9-like [Fundulus heteroclitus]|uniref:GTPase IMAP family member 9-like n=1 Tax=Fundulus heteroclitus TaxID=8078 RepID=UPI00165B909F|nr:GTPase IMAP family member 9-like [Fundulus heteroclitus]